jgi:hypothetical protein
VRQLQFFTSAEMAQMRDRTRSRNYSAERDEFRREHERHRAWGLQQRHARKLRRLRESAVNQHDSKPSDGLQSSPAHPTSRPTPPEPSQAAQDSGMSPLPSDPGRQNTERSTLEAAASGVPQPGAELATAGQPADGARNMTGAGRTNAARPASCARPAGEARPVGGAWPAEDARPVSGAQPASTARPVTGAQSASDTPSATGAQPTRTARPVTGAQPTRTARPATGAQPTSGMPPLSGTQPTSSTPPATGAQPTRTARPITGALPTSGTRPTGGGERPADEPRPVVVGPAVKRPLSGERRVVAGSHIPRRHFDGRNWSADGSQVPEISGIESVQRLHLTCPERGPPGPMQIPHYRAWHIPGRCVIHIRSARRVEMDIPDGEERQSEDAGRGVIGCAEWCRSDYSQIRMPWVA